MLKLAALGALGYAGYKYYQKNMSGNAQGDRNVRRTAVAGGPLSKSATLQHTADEPPA